MIKKISILFFASIIYVSINANTSLGCFSNKTNTALTIQKAGQHLNPHETIELDIALQAPIVFVMHDDNNTTITLQTDLVPTLANIMLQKIALYTRNLIDTVPLYTLTIAHNGDTVFSKQIPSGKYFFVICQQDDPCTTENTLAIGNYNLHAYAMGRPSKNALLQND